jgi:hypothetical protein
MSDPSSRTKKFRVRTGSAPEGLPAIHQLFEIASSLEERTATPAFTRAHVIADETHRLLPVYKTRKRQVATQYTMDLIATASRKMTSSGSRRSR